MAQCIFFPSPSIKCPDEGRIKYPNERYRVHVFACCRAWRPSYRGSSFLGDRQRRRRRWRRWCCRRSHRWQWWRIVRTQSPRANAAGETTIPKQIVRRVPKTASKRQHILLRCFQWRDSSSPDGVVLKTTVTIPRACACTARSIW